MLKYVLMNTIVFARKDSEYVNRNKIRGVMCLGNS